MVWLPCSSCVMMPAKCRMRWVGIHNLIFLNRLPNRLVLFSLLSVLASSVELLDSAICCSTLQSPAEHKPCATCLRPQPRKAKDRNSKKRRENKEQANGLQPRPKERNGKELKQARREHRKGERNKDPAPRTRKNEIKETKREQRRTNCSRASAHSNDQTGKVTTSHWSHHTCNSVAFNMICRFSWNHAAQESPPCSRCG